MAFATTEIGRELKGMHVESRGTTNNFNEKGINMETKTALHGDTMEKLQLLVRINIDSEKGLKEASHAVQDKLVATMFVELGRERANNALELQKYIEWNGEKALEKGSYLASLHRAWLGVRNLVNGGDSHAILSEAERGEDAIKLAYEDALIATAGSAMNDVLTRQYAIVKAGHDRVRAMRDQFAVH